MKKIIALLLVAVMALGMAACGAAEEKKDNTTTAGTEAGTNAPEAAGTPLEVLENVWAQYAEDQKFFAMGGYALDEEGVPVTVDGAPGLVSDTDYLTYSLLVPADAQAGLTEAASLVHAMNANTFTCGAYAVEDAQAFATAMQTAVQGNQWMCGFPETLVIANVGGVVVVAYGNGEVVNYFYDTLTATYSGAEELVNEPIAG